MLKILIFNGYQVFGVENFNFQGQKLNFIYALCARRATRVALRFKDLLCYLYIMATYTFRSHYVYEKVKRRLIYRCNHKGHYTALDFKIGDGAEYWLEAFERYRPSFECVYTTYDVDYTSADREFNKFSARRYRIFRYLKQMISNMDSAEGLFWITLTFSEDYISNKFATLKKYVIDYLNSVCTNWICCEDYGKLHNRLHFHCVGVLTPYSIAGLYWERAGRRKHLRLSSPFRYGFVDCEAIPQGQERIKLNYAMSYMSYGAKVNNGFEGFKPFHNRKFKFKLIDDSIL